MDEAVIGVARSSAESIYSTIVDAVEEDERHAKWLTADFRSGEMIHQPTLHTGVAGIGLFLADYGRAFAEDRAIELAVKALTWSESADNDEVWQRQAAGAMGVSAAMGRAGLGLAWLRLAEATDSEHAVERTVDCASYLLTTDPAKRPGLMIGTAGCAIFLTHLWERTQDARYMERAKQWAQHILDDHIDKHDYLGMGQGLAGIGHLGFVLEQATGDDRWLSLVQRSAERLLELAEPDRGHLNWRRTLGEAAITRAHWCHGAAGIGQFFVRAHEQTQVDRFLQTAIAAGECTYAYGDDRQNPSQCHGLAGKAELFADLFHMTGDRLWHDRLAEFVGLMATYRHDTDTGPRWQADEPGIYSPELVCGAAGVGHFCLRLMDSNLRMPFL